MSLSEYQHSITILEMDPSFETLIMAAAARAGDSDYWILIEMWPEITTERTKRANSLGGRLPFDRKTPVKP